MDADVQQTDVANIRFLAAEARLAVCSAAIKGDKDTDRLHKDSQLWLRLKD